MTDKTTFRIGADGVDVDAVVAQVEAAVAEKARRGDYDDPRLARAKRADLLEADSPDDLAERYLNTLADAVRVDIGDFPIPARPGPFGRLAAGFRRLAWKALRFYTYRLWSQQNQVNELLLAALEALDKRSRESARTPAQRPSRPADLPPPPCPPPGA